MSKKAKLLIVEDEEAILTGLTDVFLFHGYEVECARDGAIGLQMALANGYDLLILDVMLPEKDGFSICEEVRAKDKEVAIIMLTARTADEDIIQGLRLGADDYVAKPFSVQELVLRVESVLRRSARLRREDSILEVGMFCIDTKNLKVTPKNSGNAKPSTTTPLEFTRREVEILRFLKANKDRPVSRGELLEEVWDYRRSAFVDTRTVDIHIAKLRRKIEKDPKNPTLLITVRGEGYQLTED